MARRRRVHLVVAALLALTLAALEFTSEDRSSDSDGVEGSAPQGSGDQSQLRSRKRAATLRIGSKLPRSLPPSTGETFHVSPEGNDADAGTLERPWRTIQKALDSLEPGQRVLVHGGIYEEDLVVARAGTPEAPITIAAQSGESVVLHAASTEGDTYPVLFTDGAAYVRLRGFVIEGASGISSTNVYVQGDAHDIELARNEIRFSQDQGVFSERTTSGLAIVGNRIHDNGLGHVEGQHQSHGLYIEGQDHLIANNVIYDHPYGFGIQIYPDNRRTIVVNNTVARSGYSGIVVGGSEVNDILVRNNVLALNDKYGVEMDSSCPSNTTVDTNVFGDNGSGGLDEGCDAVDDLRRNIQANPMFLAPARGDFRLRRGSPAADRARPEHAPHTDFRGRVRPWGEGADVGAYEGPG
jgi:hypothetical protein